MLEKTLNPKNSWETQDVYPVFQEDTKGGILNYLHVLNDTLLNYYNSHGSTFTPKWENVTIPNFSYSYRNIIVSGEIIVDKINLGVKHPETITYECHLYLPDSEDVKGIEDVLQYYKNGGEVFVIDKKVNHLKGGLHKHVDYINENFYQPEQEKEFGTTKLGKVLPSYTFILPQFTADKVYAQEQERKKGLNKQTQMTRTL